MFHIKNNTPLLDIPRVLASVPPHETIILPLNAKLIFLKAVTREIRPDCFLKITCGLTIEQIECIITNLKPGIPVILSEMLSIGHIHAALSKLRPGAILHFNRNLYSMGLAHIIPKIGDGASILLGADLTLDNIRHITSSLKPTLSISVRDSLSPAAIASCLYAIPASNNLVRLNIHSHETIHAVFSALKPNAAILFDAAMPNELIRYALQTFRRGDLTYHIDSEIPDANKLITIANNIPPNGVLCLHPSLIFPVVQCAAESLNKGASIQISHLYTQEKVKFLSKYLAIGAKLTFDEFCTDRQILLAAEFLQKDRIICLPKRSSSKLREEVTQIISPGVILEQVGDGTHYTAAVRDEDRQAAHALLSLFSPQQNLSEEAAKRQKSHP